MRDCLPLQEEHSRRVRAAVYVRMSGDMQKYSIENQQHVISEYARLNNIEIVKVYEDLARSGLTLRQRFGLQQLIADVCSGLAEFSIALVYDVSRWGRFQDIDESAHYEFICRQAGVSIEYCAEAFSNDRTLLSTVMKGAKRVAAAEFSRELSERIFTSQIRSFERGFHPGGSPGFGLRRVLVGPDNQIKQVLNFGERKCLQLDRVILAPGPPREQEVVREVFRLYVNEKLSLSAIASRLNKREIRSDRGNLWSATTIKGLLENARYAGTAVFNRISSRLSTPPHKNPKEQWIRRERALEPIVDAQTYAAAQARLKEQAQYSDAELLNYLTAIWCVSGRLSQSKLGSVALWPYPTTYAEHFGSSQAAFRLVGYRKSARHLDDAVGAVLRTVERDLICRLIGIFETSGTSVYYDENSCALRVDGVLRIQVAALSYRGNHRKDDGWRLQRPGRRTCDLILVARLKKRGRGVLDFFLFPSLSNATGALRFDLEKNPHLVRWRLDALGSCYEHAQAIASKLKASSNAK